MSKKILVEALPTYKEKGIQDKTLGRIPEAKERWEVTEERLNTLLGNNEYHLVFVKIVDPSTPTEEAQPIIETEALTKKEFHKNPKRK